MTRDDLLEKLFPLPEGFKLRKPRFGNAGPSPAVEFSPLVAPAANAPQDAADMLKPPRPPFRLSWADESLGLSVDLRENPDGELIAYVTCTRPEHLGKAVSVALIGNEDRLLRKTIPLADQETYGCSGAASFGKLKQVVAELGQAIRLGAYLLE